MLSSAIVTDALIALVCVVALVANHWGSVSAAQLEGILIYALGYATARPIPAGSQTVNPPGA
jgi:hypothetical protein